MKIPIILLVSTSITKKKKALALFKETKGEAEANFP